MKPSELAVLLGPELLVLQSPLSPDEAIKRLQLHVEPSTVTTFRFSPGPFLFCGEVRDYQFSLTETVHFGKRSSGIQIVGSITGTATGSEIFLRIRSAIPEFLILGLFLVLGVVGLGWLLYSVLIGLYPLSCLIIPSILALVFGIVIYSSFSDPTPSHSNLEDHFRRIFLVTAPTRRLKS
jgi:hypothetical protein